MCLRTQNIEPRIAKKDIVCYKYLYGRLRAPFTGFPYKLGKTYTEQSLYPKFDIIDSVHMIGEGAFHAYQEIYSKKDTLGFELCYAYKAIIPKGAKYWVGMDKDICAQSIKIVRKVKWYDVLLCTLKRVFSN